MKALILFALFFANTFLAFGQITKPDNPNFSEQTALNNYSPHGLNWLKANYLLNRNEENTGTEIPLGANFFLIANGLDFQHPSITNLESRMFQTHSSAPLKQIAEIEQIVTGNPNKFTARKVAHKTPNQIEAPNFSFDLKYGDFIINTLFGEHSDNADQPLAGMLPQNNFKFALCRDNDVPLNDDDDPLNLGFFGRKWVLNRGCLTESNFTDITAADDLQNRIVVLPDPGAPGSKDDRFDTSRYINSFQSNALLFSPALSKVSHFDITDYYDLTNDISISAGYSNYHLRVGSASEEGTSLGDYVRDDRISFLAPYQAKTLSHYFSNSVEDAPYGNNIHDFKPEITSATYAAGVAGMLLSDITRHNTYHPDRIIRNPYIFTRKLMKGTANRYASYPIDYEFYGVNVHTKEVIDAKIDKHRYRLYDGIPQAGFGNLNAAHALLMQRAVFFNYDAYRHNAVPVNVDQAISLDWNKAGVFRPEHTGIGNGYSKTSYALNGLNRLEFYHSTFDVNDFLISKHMKTLEFKIDEGYTYDNVDARDNHYAAKMTLGRQKFSIKDEENNEIFTIELANPLSFYNSLFFDPATRQLEERDAEENVDSGIYFHPEDFSCVEEDNTPQTRREEECKDTPKSVYNKAIIRRIMDKFNSDEGYGKGYMKHKMGILNEKELEEGGEEVEPVFGVQNYYYSKSDYSDDPIVISPFNDKEGVKTPFSVFTEFSLGVLYRKLKNVTLEFVKDVFIIQLENILRENVPIDGLLARIDNAFYSFIPELDGSISSYYIREGINTVINKISDPNFRGDLSNAIQGNLSLEKGIFQSQVEIDENGERTNVTVLKRICNRGDNITTNITSTEKGMSFNGSNGSINTILENYGSDCEVGREHSFPTEHPNSIHRTTLLVSDKALYDLYRTALLIDLKEEQGFEPVINNVKFGLNSKDKKFAMELGSFKNVDGTPTFDYPKFVFESKFDQSFFNSQGRTLASLSRDTPPIPGQWNPLFFMMATNKEDGETGVLKYCTAYNEAYNTIELTIKCYTIYEADPFVDIRGFGFYGEREHSYDFGVLLENNNYYSVPLTGEADIISFPTAGERSLGTNEYLSFSDNESNHGGQSYLLSYDGNFFLQAKKSSRSLILSSDSKGEGCEQGTSKQWIGDLGTIDSDKEYIIGVFDNTDKTYKVDIGTLPSNVVNTEHVLGVYEVSDNGELRFIKRLNEKDKVIKNWGFDMGANLVLVYENESNPKIKEVEVLKSNEIFDEYFPKPRIHSDGMTSEEGLLVAKHSGNTDKQYLYRRHGTVPYRLSENGMYVLKFDDNVPVVFDRDTYISSTCEFNDATQLIKNTVPLNNPYIKYLIFGIFENKDNNNTILLLPMESDDKRLNNTFFYEKIFGESPNLKLEDTGKLSLHECKELNCLSWTFPHPEHRRHLNVINSILTPGYKLVKDRTDIFEDEVEMLKTEDGKQELIITEEGLYQILYDDDHQVIERYKISDLSE